MKELIKFKNVKKTYNIGEKKFNALDGIDFSINKGEFVVILGPSGAGKSTLLNLLGGMDKATSGEIIVGDEKISDYTDQQLTNYRAENVGFIFQFYNILPTLTVLENVELVNDIVKKPKNAKKILKEVGLEKHYSKFPNQLSGGEQQRVSIARVEVLKLLKKQCDANNGENTVIVVTHNALIAEIADRVIHIKNGKVESNEVNKKIKNIDEVVW